MATNVEVAHVWKLPLRDQILRDYDGETWKQNFDSLEKYLEFIRPMHFHFTHTADNKTDAVFTQLFTQSVLTSAPHDCTMIVHLTGSAGFSAVANAVQYYIADLNTGVGGMVIPGGIAAQSCPVAGNWIPTSSHAIFHYNVGQTVGYQIVYAVSASNFYFRWGAHVQIVPRRRSAVQPY